MASEDSDQLSPGLLAIHRLDDFGDIRKTSIGPMDTTVDHLNTASELFEISLLRRTHRMSRKEGNDYLNQIFSPTHRVAIQVLLVVVVPSIDEHATHSKETHQIVETRDALCALRHRELVRHLIAGLVAFPIRPVWLPNETDGEAPLSVYKTNYPAESNQPFLLVFCTHRIITVPPTWGGTRSVGYTGFPAYGRMRTARLPVRGATFYLRTVIVTAAVYRGLALVLRVKP